MDLGWHGYKHSFKPVMLWQIYEWILFDFDFWDIWKLGGRQQVFSPNLHTFLRLHNLYCPVFQAMGISIVGKASYCKNKKSVLQS